MNSLHRAQKTFGNLEVASSKNSELSESDFISSNQGSVQNRFFHFNHRSTASKLPVTENPQKMKNTMENKISQPL